MEDAELTRRQILTQAVEDLQAVHEELTKKNEDMRQSIADKRAQLGGLSDTIFAEEQRVKDARQACENAVRDYQVQADRRIEQARQQVQEVVLRASQDENAARKACEKAQEQARVWAEQMQQAMASARAAQAQLAAVQQQIRLMKEMVGGLPL